MLVNVGVCLLTLSHGELEPTHSRLRYAVYVFVSCTCIVLGSFIFGLTTTQSLMKDFGQTHSAVQPVVHNYSSYC